MSSSQESLEQKRKHSTEDWMQVLDNFLDHHQHQEDEEEDAEGRGVAEGGQYGEEFNPNHHDLQQNYPPHLSNPRPFHDDSRPESTNAESTATTRPYRHCESSCSSSAARAPSRQGIQGGQVSSNHSIHSCTDDNIDPEDAEGGTSGDKKAQIRSERKRTREKQRRSDVNLQFAALTDILKRVEDYDMDSDVSDDEDDGETKKRKIKSVGMVNVPPSNRVDLIARTVAIMERLHKVNRSLRQNVKQLRKTVKKCSMTFSDDGDDLKKTGVVNVGGGMGYGGPPAGVMMNHGNFPGMMMMMAPPTMMGQTMQQQGDGQQPMMMMVPMMMPNQMMQGVGPGGMVPSNNPSNNNSNNNMSSMMQPTTNTQNMMQQNAQQPSQPTNHNSVSNRNNAREGGNNHPSMSCSNTTHQNNSNSSGNVVGNSNVLYPSSFQGMTLTPHIQTTGSQSSLDDLGTGPGHFNSNLSSMLNHHHHQQQQQQQQQHQQQQQYNNISNNNPQMMMPTTTATTNMGMNPYGTTMPMPVYNPLTNTWNTPQVNPYTCNLQGQSFQDHSTNNASSRSHDNGHSGGSQRISTTITNNSNSSNNNNNHGSGNSSGTSGNNHDVGSNHDAIFGSDCEPFSYGGNLAHCA